MEAISILRSIRRKATLLGAITFALLSLLRPLAHSAPLTPTATLLISLDTTEEQKKFLIGGLYKNYSAKIERKFRQILGNSGLSLHVIDRADLHDLDRELRNPENVALFWLSHASDPRQILNAPMGALDPVILDMHGSDIKRLFAHPHPNLRWLSVIACSSGLILDENGEVLSEDNPPELEKGESVEVPDVAPGIPALMVQRFTTKKGAILGMAQAAREARRFFRAVPELRSGYQLAQCPAENLPAPAVLQLTRVQTGNEPHPALAVLWNGKRVGTTPGLSQSAQTAAFPLDDSLDLLRQYAIAGQSTPLQVTTLFEGARKLARDYSLGDITLKLRITRNPPYAQDLELPLNRVEKRPGVPLGTVTHLFELNLNFQERQDLAEALEFLEARARDSACPAVAPFMESR